MLGVIGEVALQEIVSAMMQLKEIRLGEERLQETFAFLCVPFLVDFLGRRQLSATVVMRNICWMHLQLVASAQSEAVALLLVVELDLVDHCKLTLA
ncbi:hypothetical protein RUND412_008623, partial [Rhizina undulata]